MNYPEIRPEMGLLYAVLERAILDATGSRIVGAYRPTQGQREARAWINNWDPSDLSPEPFSFPWICQHLGVDATRLRAEILSIDNRLGKNSGYSWQGIVKKFEPLPSYSDLWVYNL